MLKFFFRKLAQRFLQNIYSVLADCAQLCAMFDADICLLVVCV